MAENKTKVEHSIIAPGTEFEGVVVSSCGIIVGGRITGDLSAPSLHVHEKGTVGGRIKVGSLISRGEISGEIDADKVELSGRVGDRTVLRAKTLDVKLGEDGGPLRVAFGDCELQVGGAVASGSGRAQAKAAATPEPETVTAR